MRKSVGPRRKRRAKPIDSATLGAQIEEARVRVRPLLPDMDEQSLITILASVLQPFGTGKHFLLKRRADGGFVF
ncbi:MAG: hypothetical protein KF819_33830 [Labilithrix sp.]|nr:hypothetical protein [Labilithrix sp.]